MTSSHFNIHDASTAIYLTNLGEVILCTTIGPGTPYIALCGYSMIVAFPYAHEMVNSESAHNGHN